MTPYFKALAKLFCRFGKVTKNSFLAQGDSYPRISRTYRLSIKREETQQAQTSRPNLIIQGGSIGGVSTPALGLSAPTSPAT